MLESVQGLARDFFGQDKDSDGRKREYGDLDSHMAQRRRRKTNPVNSGRRKLMTEVNGDDDLGGMRSRGIRKPGGQRRKRVYQDKIEKGVVADGTKQGTVMRVLGAIKMIFSPEAENLNTMKKVSGNIDKVIPSNRISDSTRYSQLEERRIMRERIAKSEAFKRKLLEKRRDEVLLDQLKRGRSRSREYKQDSIEYSDNRSIKNRNLNMVDDQVFLLQKKVDGLESKLLLLEKELFLSKKKLKFAKEKNTLLESLLDDANIDSEYVKSRRDIKNLQKENLIPETDLPPSPRRTVNPLFTSSPMRKTSARRLEDEPSLQPTTTTTEFYNKYPKIPETETLTQGKRERSLSPINIDYSKYSSPR